jgi:hypothetical protein
MSNLILTLIIDAPRIIKVNMNISLFISAIILAATQTALAGTLQLRQEPQCQLVECGDGYPPCAEGCICYPVGYCGDPIGA